MPNVAHRPEYMNRIRELASEGLPAQLDYLWQQELSERNPDGSGRFDEKRPWVESMIREYAATLRMRPEALFVAMESNRRYWSANYYQQANQPPLGKIRVFETQAEVEAAIPRGTLFRCPACDGLSKHPTVCDSGKIFGDKPCDWKAFGLLGTLGKGFRCVVKEKVLAGDFAVFEIFWPESIPKC
jgi:hypothetical protein